MAIINLKYSGGAKVDMRTGKIIEWVAGRGTHIQMATTMKEKRGKIYLGSLFSPVIAIIDPTKIKRNFPRKDSNEDL